ncbi:MAG: hypothetical protein MRK00_03665 [Nitrosomonas sp.]|nr:hypothetical protein [Nitrosomonas sp.]
MNNTSAITNFACQTKKFGTLKESPGCFFMNMTAFGEAPVKRSDGLVNSHEFEHPGVFLKENFIIYTPAFYFLGQF